MTLGEYIKKYRSEHGLSQRQFANLCGVSNGYASMLEKGMNPSHSAKQKTQETSRFPGFSLFFQEFLPKHFFLFGKYFFLRKSIFS
jgi:transcriptional regulator with XRE-family HTH domain